MPSTPNPNPKATKWLWAWSKYEKPRCWVQHSKNRKTVSACTQESRTKGRVDANSTVVGVGSREGRHESDEDDQTSHSPHWVCWKSPCSKDHEERPLIHEPHTTSCRGCTAPKSDLIRSRVSRTDHNLQTKPPKSPKIGPKTLTQRAPTTDHPNRMAQRHESRTASNEWRSETDNRRKAARNPNRSGRIKEYKILHQNGAGKMNRPAGRATKRQCGQKQNRSERELKKCDGDPKVKHCSSGRD